MNRWPSFFRLLVPSAGVLRVGAYAFFAFTVAGLLAARVLCAEVGEAALAAGHELASLSDLVGNAETVLVNGERLHHVSTHTEGDVAAVLDRVEAYCAKSPSFIGRALAELPRNWASPAEHAGPRRWLRLGFLRSETRQRGMVACFVDDRPASLRSFAARLQRLTRTMTLGELGQFRYFYAERGDQGPTHVVATWADTALDVRAMFPAHGDAAGADSKVLPRPPEARRTLSAAAEGMPYGVRVYESAAGAGAVRAFYDAWMQKNGFLPVAEGDGSTAAYLRADGYQAFVSTGEESGRSFVTLTEAGPTSGPPLTSAAVESPSSEQP